MLDLYINPVSKYILNWVLDEAIFSGEVGTIACNIIAN